MDTKLFVSVLMMALVRQSVSLTSNGIYLTSMVISNTSLILSCHIADSSCCKNIDEVEFKKSSKGMCSLIKCDGKFDQPIDIPDIKYHHCGCAGEEPKETYLHITNLTALDYGNWTCTCYDEGERGCISNVLHIAQDTLLKTIEGQSSRNDDIPLMMSSTHDTFLLPIVFIGGVIVTVIIICVVMVLARRDIRQRRGPTESNQLLRFGFKLLGLRKEDFRNPDIEDTATRVTPNDEEGTALLPPSSSTGAQSSVLEMKEGTIRSVQDMITQQDDASRQEVLMLISQEIPIFVHDCIQKRLKPDDCYCGKCVELINNVFSCCKDKRSEKECMSLNEDFQRKCLNEKELMKKLDLSIYKSIKQRNHFLRHTAYRSCDYLINGWKKGGKVIVVYIPACCIKKIREAFPDPDMQYNGNKWHKREDHEKSQT